MAPLGVAADLAGLAGAACASRPLRDAAFVVTVSECTADPSRCCVAANRFCARDGGCCYSVSGCSPRGARLTPSVCDPSSGAVVPAPAGVCACNHVSTIALGLPLPPGVQSRLPGCASTPATTLPPTVPVVPGAAPRVAAPLEAAPGGSCDAARGTRGLTWAAVADGCGSGRLPCCAHASAMGTVGGCMYSWSGCNPSGVKVTPAVCVDAATNAVRLADVAAGECGCDRVVATSESALPPLAYRRRSTECGPVLAGQTDAYEGVGAGVVGGGGSPRRRRWHHHHRRGRHRHHRQCPAVAAAPGLLR